MLSQYTRKVLNAASRLHSASLARLVRHHEKAEELAARRVEDAEAFSRWANEQKRQARAALTDAIDSTEQCVIAVSAELDTLPACTQSAARIVPFN